MQLASSLPGLGAPSPEMMKALQYNPILYYSYYAQMLTALQAQQKILDMNNNRKQLIPATAFRGLNSLNKL